MQRSHARSGLGKLPSASRRSILLLPLAGSWLLTACSRKDGEAGPNSPPTQAPSTAPSVGPAMGSSQTPTPPAAAAPATTGTEPMAALGAVVDEQETLAQGLGYVADARRVDSAKFKTHQAGQVCSNCTLFAGKAGDTVGPCPLFGGRQVAAKGWCSSYVKKAA